MLAGLPFLSVPWLREGKKPQGTGSTLYLGEIPACQQPLVPKQKWGRGDRKLFPLQ